MKDEFVLPEKGWHIKITDENAERISKYVLSIAPDYDRFWGINQITGMSLVEKGDSPIGFIGWSKSVKTDSDFPEITFEQFEKYVLKKDSQEEEGNDKWSNSTILKHDPVNNPSHYTRGKIEVIDFIIDQKLDFTLGNATKYIVRAGHKDKATEIEDLRKAIKYIEFKINSLQTAK